MTRATYLKYKRLIKTPTWQERDIIAFRSMLNKCIRFPSGETAFDGRTRYQVANELLHEFRRHAPYQITPEQSSKGLDWIRRTCFRHNGQIRQAKDRPFEVSACEKLAQLLPRFQRWTLDDIENHSQGYGAHYVPVYTLHATTGSFTYAPGRQGQVMAVHS